MLSMMHESNVETYLFKSRNGGHERSTQAFIKEGDTVVAFVMESEFRGWGQTNWLIDVGHGEKHTSDAVTTNSETGMEVTA